MNKRIYNFLDKISYKNRYHEAFALFRKKRLKYLQMSDDEFLMNYIETRAKYENKKIKLTIVVIVWITFIFMNDRKCFLETITKRIANCMTAPKNVIIKFSLFIDILFGGIVFFIGVVILIVLLNDLYKLSKEKNLLEEIKEIR